MPVGIDEGNTVEDKFRIALNCIDFLKQVEKTPKIAILAEGREDDFGRDSSVSNSIKDSRKLTKLLSENTDEDVKNYHILIEKAVQDKRNIIIAPNGRVGNIIFRTMVLLNSWPGINGGSNSNSSLISSKFCLKSHHPGTSRSMSLKNISGIAPIAAVK